MTGRTIRFGIAAGLIALAALPALGQAEPAGTMAEVSSRSQKDLEAATSELSELRETIAGEKMPLARKLTDLGDRLAALRRESEEVLRAIDLGTLEATREEAEVNLKGDEVVYLTNLLDEYVKTFETRIGVGEAKRYSEVLTIAKEAVADRDLDQRGRFERQFAAVDASIERLDDVIGGTRFEGSAVAPDGTVAEGTFAAVGPIALFASTDRAVVGLALSQSGSSLALARPLEGPMQASIASLVEAGQGTIPLDATVGGALQEMVQRWNLLDVYKQGGPIMHPLLFVSILALAVVIERVIFIIGEQGKRDPRALQNLFAAVEIGDLRSAIRLGNESKDFVVRTLAYALEHRERSIGNALVVANANVIKRFRRGIGVLDTAITIAPLLGLLGTVTGMMHSFSLIGGELSAPGAITGGIAEALIATAFGLMIAIVCLVPYNYLNNKVEQVRQETEAASAQLELLMHPDRGIVNAISTAHAAAVQGAA